MKTEQAQSIESDIEIEAAEIEAETQKATVALGNSDPLTFPMCVNRLTDT